MRRARRAGRQRHSFRPVMPFLLIDRNRSVSVLGTGRLRRPPAYRHLPPIPWNRLATASETGAPLPHAVSAMPIRRSCVRWRNIGDRRLPMVRGLSQQRRRPRHLRLHCQRKRCDVWLGKSSTTREHPRSTAARRQRRLPPTAFSLRMVEIHSVTASGVGLQPGKGSLRSNLKTLRLPIARILFGISAD